MLSKTGPHASAFFWQIARKTGNTFNRWAWLAVEFCGLALLSATAVVATVLPERWNAAGGVAMPLVAAWVAAAIFFLYALSGGGRVWGFNPILVFLAVVRAQVDLKLGILTASAQIAGAFAGVMIAQYALNLDPVQAPDLGRSGLTHAATECFAGFCIAMLGMVRFRRAITVIPSRSRDHETRAQDGSDERERASSCGSQSSRTRSLALIALAARTYAITGEALATPAVYFLFIAFGPGVAFGNPALTLARTLTTNALGLQPLEALTGSLAALLGAVASWLCLARALKVSY